MKIESLPPILPQIARRKKICGRVHVDAYAYLEDIDNPRTQRYIRAENRYAKTILKSCATTYKHLKFEMQHRIPRMDQTVPSPIRDYIYYSRSFARKDYPIYYRKAREGRVKEEMILDVNLLAKGKSCCMVTGLAVSPDGNYLCYGINFTGGIGYQIRVRDLRTQKEIREKISHTDGDGIWSEDGEYLFYAKREPRTLRTSKVFRHKMGTPISEDVCVFSEEDSTFDCSVWKTKSDRFIVLSTSSSTTTEHYFLDATDPLGNPWCIAPRKENVEYYPEDCGDKLMVLTNENADDFKIVQRDLYENTNQEEIVLHVSGRLIDDFEVFNDALVYLIRENATHKFVIYPLEKTISESEIVYEGETLAFEDNPNIDASFFRFQRTSMTQPDAVLSYHFKTQKIEVLKENIVKDYQPNLYTSKMIFAPSRDGKTRIPITLAWRNDLHQERTPSPIYLRAYGAYGISSDPAFRISRVSLLDRGFITAIAHVRGGEEMGRNWYNEGKMLHKKNSFYDFIDCAQFLIQEQYTTPSQFAIGGGSAGGLLMGGVLNMAPELFRFAVLDVPFLDVINTMTNPNQPLTTGEYNEWGNPKDHLFYEYILDYSPYDNVAKRPYPMMYITGNLNDDQVPYWEPLKFTAKVRAMNPEGDLVLMRTDTESGHMGPTGRKAEISEIAHELALMVEVCAPRTTEPV